MADVFISYHRSDGASALVRRIAGELESRGVSCWYDTKKTNLFDFIARIVTEIDLCKIFLFLWDEKANEDVKKGNSYVRREMHMAFEKNVALLSFQIGNFEKNPIVEFYFSTINISYGGDSPETAHIEELVDAIADALGKTQPQTPPLIVMPQPQPATPVVMSAKIIKSGKCGDNVTYELNENGVLTISGSDAMWGFGRDTDIPWWDERKMISQVEIKNGVTMIGDRAFFDCAELTSVNIPDSVDFIGWRTFDGCEKLKSVGISAKAQIYWSRFPMLSA